MNCDGKSDDSGPSECLDIAVLKAKDISETEFFTFDGEFGTATGRGFYMGKPAMFFQHKSMTNITPSGDASDSKSEKTKARRPDAYTGDNPTKLFATHFTNWPTSGPDMCARAPLISNPGFAGGGRREESFSECFERDTKAKDVTYTNLVRTSLDMSGGSSGGALLHREVHIKNEQFEYSDRTWDLIATGIFSNAHFEDSDFRNWRTPLKGSGDDSLDPNHDYDFPDENYNNEFTAATKEIEKWSKRDKDWHCWNCDQNPSTVCRGCTEDPFRPVPAQPPTQNGEPGPCDITVEEFEQEHDVDLEYPPNMCMRRSSSIEYPGQKPWPNPPPVADLRPMDETHPSFIDGLEYRGECYQVRSRTWTGRKTDFSRWEVTGAGLVAGIMASPTDPSLDDRTRVASFSGICAPWSHAEWSRNWRDLHLLFPTAVRGYGGTFFEGTYGSKSATGGALSHVLTDVAEERKDPKGGETYLRPPSFKMCPPNYYVYGLGVVTREPEKDESKRRQNIGRVLVGIESLICHRPTVQANHIKEKNGKGHVVYAAPSSKNSRIDQDQYKGYEITRRTGKDLDKTDTIKFSLDQHLGNPGKVVGGMDVQFDKITCKKAEKNNGNRPYFVGGFHIGRKKGSLAIQNLKLGCIEGPMPKLPAQSNVANLCARAPLPIGSVSRPFPTGRCVRLRGLNPIRRISKTKFLAKVGVSGGPSAVSVMLDKPANPRSVKGGVGRVVGSASYKIPGGGKQTVPEIQMLKR